MERDRAGRKEGEMEGEEGVRGREEGKERRKKTK